MITSLESNIGCCQALPQSSGDSERLPFCFFVFFFFVVLFLSGFLWELGLCAPESSLHPGLIWHAPFYTNVFICVCLGLPQYRAKLLWHLNFSLGLHSLPCA